MQSSERLNQAFHVIMQKMTATGRAPFYIELAAELGVAPEEGRKIQKDLFAAGIAVWTKIM